MSSNGSVIAQPAGQRTLVVRESYLGICGGDICEAQLLNSLERWYAYKLQVRSEARGRNKSARQRGVAPDVDEALWVRMSAGEWAEKELLGIYNEKTIRAKLKSLVDRGFIWTRAHPKFGWDRTPQWLFNRVTVQEAVDQWEASHPAPDINPSEADAKENESQGHSEDGDRSIRTNVRMDADEIPSGEGKTSASSRKNVRSHNTEILNRDLLQDELTGGEYNITANACAPMVQGAQVSQIVAAPLTTTTTSCPEDKSGADSRATRVALPPSGGDADASITDEELRFLFGTRSQANEESVTMTSTENVPPAAPPAQAGFALDPDEPHDPETTRARLFPALGGQKKLNQLMEETPPGLQSGQRRSWITRITPDRATELIAEGRKLAGADNAWTYIIRLLDKEVGAQINRKGGGGAVIAQPSSYDPPAPPVIVDVPRPGDIIEIGTRWQHKHKKDVTVTIVGLKGPMAEFDTGEQLMLMYVTKDYQKIHS